MRWDNPFSLTTNDLWIRDWWITLFLKLALAVFIPFFADEAYYWVWAQNLQLSYFDHPAFVAWLFKPGLIFDSIGFASRWPFILVSHFTLFLWCHFFTQDLSSQAKRVLFWVLLIHPLIGLGGFVANPDVPFLFFWTLSLLLYTRCLLSPKNKKSAFFLGLCLGLGFCSKYLMVLALPVLAAHLIISSQWKRITVPTFLITFLSGLFFSLPVLVWNYQHDWISMGFQLHHGLGQQSWRPQWTSDFLIGTLLLLFPPYVFLFFKKINWRQLDLHTTIFFVLIAFFTWTTLRGDTELNWPVILYPSFFLCIIRLHANNFKTHFVYLAFFGALFVFILGGTLGLWGEKLHGRLAEGLRYQRLFKQVNELKPVMTSTYQTASYFWYLSKTPYMKLNSASRPDQYDLFPNSTPSGPEFFYIKESYQIIPVQFENQYTFKKIRELTDGFELYKAEKQK